MARKRVRYLLLYFPSTHYCSYLHVLRCQACDGQRFVALTVQLICACSLSVYFSALTLETMFADDSRLGADPSTEYLITLPASRDGPVLVVSHDAIERYGPLHRAITDDLM